MPLIFQGCFFIYEFLKLLKGFILRALAEIPYICIQPDLL